MKKLLTIIISIVLFSNYSLAQTKTISATLNKYEIIDSNLAIVIDSFLVSEQVCNYYSDSLNISISICNYDDNLDNPCREADTLMVIISSIIWGNETFYNAVGYTTYKGHLIVIKNLATTKLFHKTNYIKTFKYSEETWLNSNGEVILVRPDDDSQTSWLYNCYDGKLFLEYRTPNCLTKRKK